MIKILRKKHLQIWTALAVLLPSGIIAGWLAIPQPVKDHLLQPASTNALPVIIRSNEKQNPFVAIRSNADTSVLQLECINNAELTFPSALIYQVKDSVKNIEDGEIVGRIEMRGIYHFPLKKDSTEKDFHFLLYDIIHHKIIQRINF